MNYLKLMQYIRNVEESKKYSDESWHDYIPLCDLKCVGISVREAFIDAKYAGAGEG